MLRRMPGGVREEILNFIDFESEKEEIYMISADHQKELEISLEQIKNGDTISNEGVNAKVQKWLLKYCFISLSGNRNQHKQCFIKKKDYLEIILFTTVFKKHFNSIRHCTHEMKT